MAFFRRSGCRHGRSHTGCCGYSVARLPRASFIEAGARLLCVLVRWSGERAGERVRATDLNFQNPPASERAGEAGSNFQRGTPCNFKRERGPGWLAGWLEFRGRASLEAGRLARISKFTVPTPRDSGWRGRREPGTARKMPFWPLAARTPGFLHGTLLG